MKGGSLQMVTEKFRFPDGHCFNARRKNEKNVFECRNVHIYLSEQCAASYAAASFFLKKCLVINIVSI